MREIQCMYKGERFSVRDDGTVLRHPPAGKRYRPYDNHWTIGKLNQDGYLVIASMSIHRIVATAFHGDPPTEGHVVDHIDTNRQNNRPNNLRWVTRLENIVLNPITAKRIAERCGSVEAFLADPSKFRDRFPEPNLQWMGRVTEEEAQVSLKRLSVWATSDRHPSGGSLDQWIFNRNGPRGLYAEVLPEEPELIMAQTMHAAQRNWKTPAEFPCCPQGIVEEPIIAYAENLTTGSVFCRDKFQLRWVSKSRMSDDHQSLFVIAESKDELKPWALTSITYENGLFVHTSLGTYFTQDGAEKKFCLALGVEWLGQDSIDDYC